MARGHLTDPGPIVLEEFMGFRIVHSLVFMIALTGVGFFSACIRSEQGSSPSNRVQVEDGVPVPAEGPTTPPPEAPVSRDPAQGAGDAALAEKGRQIYLSACIVCHAQDPSKEGPLGPAIKGSSAELLRAKVIEGTYPPGYTPKRNTRIMPPQPQFKNDIDALAAFLK